MSGVHACTLVGRGRWFIRMTVWLEIAHWTHAKTLPTWMLVAAVANRSCLSCLLARCSLHRNCRTFERSVRGWCRLCGYDARDGDCGYSWR